MLTATDANAKLAGQRGEQCQSTLRVHLTTLNNLAELPLKPASRSGVVWGEMLHKSRHTRARTHHQ